jgi:hypothetical protein
MIRQSKFEKMVTGLNVDLTAQSPELSGTFTPALPPKEVLPMYQRAVASHVAPPKVPLDYVPMQDKPNTMASEDDRVNKVTDSSKMAYDALRPVGSGATMFSPFPLKYC